jgi:hypothetical protein
MSWSLSRFITLDANFTSAFVGVPFVFLKRHHHLSGRSPDQVDLYACSCVLEKPTRGHSPPTLWYATEGRLAQAEGTKQHESELIPKGHGIQQILARAKDAKLFEEGQGPEECAVKRNGEYLLFGNCPASVASPR